MNIQKEALSIGDIVKVGTLPVFTVTKVFPMPTNYVRVVGVTVDGKSIRTNVNTSGSFQVWE